MRLVLDLRLGTVHRDADGEPDERWLRPQDLAARIRRPSELLSVLRGTRYESVCVLCDEIPLNGVQSAAMTVIAAARTDSFRVTRPGASVSTRRAPFAARAIAGTLVGLPVEVARTIRGLAAVWRVARRAISLPSTKPEPRAGLYLYRPRTAMGSTTGGSAVHTAGVVNALAESGLEMKLLGPELPPGVEAGSAFERVPVRRRYHLVQWLTVSDYSRALEHVASREHASFVYERAVAGSYAGVAVAKRLGVPLVLEFNGSDVWIAEHWGGRRLAFSSLARALERRNLRSASLVVVLSDALKDELVSLGIANERILVNAVGVDVDRLAPLREREPSAWRAELGLDESPTVAFIGTFGLWHGVRLLPDVIARVADQQPEARWVLIGGGPLHGDVVGELERRGLDGRVKVTGALPRADAMRLLAAADVCVSPHVQNPDGSRFFGSPTKLFEYMALGKAIVASDLEQLGEVVDHGRNGLLHAAGDAAAAADAVSRLIRDGELRSRLGEAALHDALHRFSWRAHVERTLRALVSGQ
jgi:glycosyltransferase involved in cell wall biosynthesis